MPATWRTSEGETVDLICWRAFGTTRGLTEALLEANPGLADKGAFLPVGTLVTLPEKAAAQVARPIRLWD